MDKNQKKEKIIQPKITSSKTRKNKIKQFQLFAFSVKRESIK